VSQLGGYTLTPAGVPFLPYAQGSGLPRGTFLVVLPLTASNAAGGVAGWRNPFPFNVVPKQTTLIPTTASAGASTVQVGKAPNLTSNPTTNYGAAANTGVATSNYNGFNGATTSSAQTVGPGECITAGMASGDVTGLTGWLVLQLEPKGSVRN